MTIEVPFMPGSQVFQVDRQTVMLGTLAGYWWVDGKLAHADILAKTPGSEVIRTPITSLFATFDEAVASIVSNLQRQIDASKKAVVSAELALQRAQEALNERKGKEGPC